MADKDLRGIIKSCPDGAPSGHGSLPAIQWKRLAHAAHLLLNLSTLLSAAFGCLRIADLMKTYVKYPPRKLQSEVCTGAMTLT